MRSAPLRQQPPARTRPRGHVGPSPLQRPQPCARLLPSPCQRYRLGGWRWLGPRLGPWLGPRLPEPPAGLRPPHPSWPPQAEGRAGRIPRSQRQSPHGVQQGPRPRVAVPRRLASGPPRAMRGLCRRPASSAPGTLKGPAMQRPCADQPLPARCRAEGGRRRLSLGAVRAAPCHLCPLAWATAVGTIPWASAGGHAWPQAAGSSWASGSSRRLLQLPGAGQSSWPTGSSPRRQQAPT
jgi:hypothetical protein